MTIHCKLDVLLQRHGKTIQQVYLDTGIARSVLAEMRDNQRKRYDAAVMAKLCTYFDCSLCDLIDYIPAQPHLDAAPPRLLAEDGPGYDPRA